jgi:glycogen(starch) synthase
LHALLRSLEEQTFSGFEVVVVVGPTRDDTLEVLSRDFEGRLHVVRCPEFNLSRSRNLGIAHSVGGVVAFIDDDSTPSPTWLEQLVAVYRNEPDVAGVGGKTILVRPEHEGVVQFQRGVVSVLAEQEDVRRDDRLPLKILAPPALWYPRLHGTNMSYRREALLSIGGFDERFEYLFDDADVGVRLGRIGREIRQLDDAIVYHAAGGGRNRGRHPFDLNWYSWLRSTIYFALVNGRPALGWRRSLIGAVRVTAHFSARLAELAASEELPPELHRKARRSVRRAIVAGFVQGLAGGRRIPGVEPAAPRPFLPFPQGGDGEEMPEPRARPSVPAPGGSGRLRVCLLSVGYPPRDTHGVSRSTEALARGLQERGHEVHVVTAGEREGTVVRDDVFVHRVVAPRLPRYEGLASRGYLDLVSWLNHSHAVHRAVQELQRNHGVQLVDAPLWNLDGLATAVAGEIPVVVRAVTAMRQIARIHRQETPETTLLGELEQSLLDSAAAIASNSEATARALEEVYGIDLGGRLHRILPYGIVPSAEGGGASSDGGESVKILYVGRLEGRKGVRELFAAIPKVLQAVPGARFVVAGADNSAEDGFLQREGLTYPEYFRKRYRRAAGAVELPGYVDEEELKALYLDCDLFVAPSVYESFGLIYLEAMNAGKPVVACRAGGPEGIVVDGETGLLVPPRDADALAGALIHLAGSSDLRHRMGRQGRRRLLERFSHRAMAEAFEDLYRVVLERRAVDAPVLGSRR